MKIRLLLIFLVLFLAACVTPDGRQLSLSDLDLDMSQSGGMEMWTGWEKAPADIINEEIEYVLEIKQLKDRQNLNILAGIEETVQPREQKRRIRSAVIDCPGGKNCRTIQKERTIGTEYKNVGEPFKRPAKRHEYTTTIKIDGKEETISLKFFQVQNGMSVYGKTLFFKGGTNADLKMDFVNSKGYVFRFYRIEFHGKKKVVKTVERPWVSTKDMLGKDKRIMLYIFGKDHGLSKEQSKTINSMLSMLDRHFIMSSAIGMEGDKVNKELTRKYNLTSVPAIVFIEPDGKVIKALQGLQSKKTLQKAIQEVVHYSDKPKFQMIVLSAKKGCAPYCPEYEKNIEYSADILSQYCTVKVLDCYGKDKGNNHCKSARGMPSTLFFTADGKHIGSRPGVIKPYDLVTLLQKIRDMEPKLEPKLEPKPKKSTPILDKELPWGYPLENLNAILKERLGFTTEAHPKNQPKGYMTLHYFMKDGQYLGVQKKAELVERNYAIFVYNKLAFYTLKYDTEKWDKQLKALTEEYGEPISSKTPLIYSAKGDNYNPVRVFKDGSRVAVLYIEDGILKQDIYTSLFHRNMIKSLNRKKGTKHPTDNFPF